MRLLFLLFVFSFLLSSCGRPPEQTTGAVGSQPKPLPELKIDLVDPSQIENLKVGSSKHDVIQTLGDPTGNLQMAETETLYYYGVAIEFAEDRVSRIPDDLVDEIKLGYTKTKERAKADVAKAKAKAHVAKVKAQVAKRVGSSGSQSNQKIRKNGQRIDLTSLVGKGSITIVDFYADWCGPCKSIEPRLEKLAMDPSVNLIQIDIVDWSKPVVSQYSIRSIPNIRVFDANGKQVGDPTSSLSAIQKYIKQAKKSS